MAETERDEKVSAGYRALGSEEPPRALDDAILAASRRAVKGRNRWYVPLAAAAVVVLAVAVTVHVERERPSEEIVTAVEPQKEVMADQPKSEPARRAEPKPFAAEPPPPPPLPSESRMRENVAKAERQGQRPPASQPESAGADRREKMEALAKRADEAKAAKGAPSAPARSASAPLRQERILAASEAEGIPGSMGPLPTLAHATPEQRLQGIADLRRQGRHEDADKALAEFRRAYPQYRISEEMRAKVEREPARAR